MMRRVGAFATLFALSLTAPDAAGQVRRPAPLPQGNRIPAQHGDIIVLEGDAQVKILRRRDANIRIVFSRAERWLVLLADIAGSGGPDGRVDWTYNWRDVSGDWPIADRWEGPATIEEYWMSSPGPSSRGLGFTSPVGLIQLLAVPLDVADFRDPGAAAVLTYRGGGSGIGGGESFDRAEARQIDNIRRSVERGMQIQTLPGGGRTELQAGISMAPAPLIDGMAAVRVGGTIRTPEKIIDVAPVLPDTAKRAGVRGMVILEVTIGADGMVRDAKVLRSIPLLDAAAIEAVRQWRYTPVTVNGQPVPVILTVPVTFE